MMDLIVFRVGNNSYAMNIENIQRIIQAENLTDIPNSNELIDGMMSYESNVIKVLNFRKLIGLPTYDAELKKLFVNLKIAHKEWIDALKHAVENSVKFSKTTDPHKCELGKWLDNFNSYDDSVNTILKNLDENHKHLHASGAEVLDLAKNDPQKAKEIVEQEISTTFHKTMGNIDSFVKELATVSNSLQKLLLYEKNTENFAIKVDSIEDIAHIQESDIMQADEEHSQNEFLELQGVLDLNGVLINVIKTVNIPK